MKAQPSHPIDILWQPGTLLSVFAAGELLALVFALAGVSSDDTLSRFGLLSFAVQWVAVLTLSLLYFMRSELRALKVGSIVAFALAALLAVVLASTYVSWRVLGPLWQGNEADWWRAGWRFYIAMVAMVLFGMLALRSEWQSRRMQLRAKQAELDSLRARVNPHFLFNTLNTATALLHDRPDQAERVLLDMSDLFRAALSGKELSSLAQEVALTRRYLEIESLRLGERLSVDWQVPDELPAMPIPTLSLQAMVENAIHHGVEVVPGPIILAIQIVEFPKYTVLRVENPVAHAAPRTHEGHHVGIASTRARIEAMTSGPGSLHTWDQDTKFIAEIRLPMQAPASEPGDDHPTTS